MASHHNDNGDLNHLIFFPIQQRVARSADSPVFPIVRPDRRLRWYGRAYKH
jgi:hypothetical protein